MATVIVVVLQVLCHQLQALGAAGHPSGVVCVDRGDALVPAERPVSGGVVDHAAFFVRCVVRLRSMINQGRVVEVFWHVVKPSSWVAEGELRVREQGVDIVVGRHRCWSSSLLVVIIVGRHRSCCLEKRILLFVTVMIACSSRAWRWLRDQFLHKGDSLGHTDLGEPYQPRVGSAVEVDEFTEILVHGDEDPVLGDGPFQ